ncbi:MAG TPA: hypothetical protein VJN70_14315 [Gemmatimonadaceae bacterium]|nr:hypothetical protein [Gemmatimonadaceae bacterium]
MRQFIHEHSTHVKAPDGIEYCARTYAASRADGTWSGWIEFVTAGGGGGVLKTDQETSQPDRKAIEYWAGGLQPVYLEGALNRALKLAAISS